LGNSETILITMFKNNKKLIFRRYIRGIYYVLSQFNHKIWVMQKDKLTHVEVSLNISCSFFVQAEFVWSL